MRLVEANSNTKKNHLERLLTLGGIMIFVDTRKKDVQVPTQHLGNPQLPLNLDYAFQIPDFKILQDRIEATLSFNRQDFLCVLPMPAIYVIRSHVLPEIIVFPEDVPKNFALVQSPESASQREGGATPQPKLIAVTGKKPEDADIQKLGLKKKKKPANKTSHLKLVKS